jgi:hypothetical protein
MFREKAMGSAGKCGNNPERQKMKSRVNQRLIGLPFLLVLVLFPARPIWGYSGSVFSGVEEGELFSGSKFALNANYDLMLSLYEKNGLGSGFYYHDDFVKLNLTDEPRLKQYGFNIPNLALSYTDDRILDQKDGIIAFAHNNLFVDGTYAGDELDTQSRLSISYKLSNSLTQLNYSQDKIDGLLNDFEFKERFELAGNTFEADYQNNQYRYGDNKIIGEGGELLWTPAWSFIRVGAGHFIESSTGAVSDRTRVRTEYYRSPSGLDNWKFGGSLEGFLYSQGERRFELTARGQYRKTRADGGYYQLTYEDIQRTGDTPFEFDDEPVHTSDATAEFNWHFGNNNSDLLLNYDFTKSQWDKVKGYTEFPIGGGYSVLWIAQYDFDYLYEEDQTTYLLELKHSGVFTLFNRLEWNYKFSMLEVSSKTAIPVGRDLLEMELSYSFYYDSLDVLKLNYTIYKTGQLTLKCEFERDRFMLIYTWL